MRNSDKLRMLWIDKHLVTVYGPYRCYSVWEAWAWVAVLVILFAVAWRMTP